jgi:hypothetical protein
MVSVNAPTSAVKMILAPTFRLLKLQRRELGCAVFTRQVNMAKQIVPWIADM